MYHVCAPCMSYRGQKPALNSLELELHVAVSFPVEVLGAEPRFSAEQQVLLTSRPSLESASLATFVSRCCSRRLSSSCPPRDMEQSVPSVPCLVFSSFFFFFYRILHNTFPRQIFENFGFQPTSSSPTFPLFLTLLKILKSVS